MGRADGRYQIKVPNHGTKQRYQITVAKQALSKLRGIFLVLLKWRGLRTTYSRTYAISPPADNYKLQRPHSVMEDEQQ